MLNQMEQAETVGAIAPDLLLPLTGIQNFVWFHQRMDPSATPYNIGNLLHISGVLDVEKFTAAHDLMLQQTDCLRIRFSEIDNAPFQSVTPFEHSPIEIWDLRNAANPEVEGEQLLRSIEKKPFNLLKDALYRFGLIRTANNRWIFFTFFHHLIIDAVGGSKIFTDLEEFFLKIGSDVASDNQIANQLSWMYAVKDYQRYKSSEQWLSDQAFWSDKLAGLEKPASLSDQSIKRAELSLPGSAFYKLDRKQYETICEWGLKSGRSAYAGFATAAIVYLTKFSNSKDICIGTPNAGRNKITRNLIGMLANATPLRIQISDEDLISDILLKTSKELRSGLRHTQYPYGEITQDRRKSNLDAPFSLIVNYLALKQVVYFGDAVGVVETWGAGPVSDMEIHIFDRMDGGPIDIRLDFNQERYSKDEAQAHLDRFAQLLIRLPDFSSKRLVETELLPEQEVTKILSDSRGPEFSWDKEELLLDDLFSRAVADSPNKPAILFSHDEQIKSLSYIELDERSNQMARFLIAQKVGPESIVGIVLQRSPELLTSILAVLKAGAAYLPIDPSYPTERIEHMLIDSRTTLMLSTSSIYNALKESLSVSLPKVITLDDEELHKEIKATYSKDALLDSDRLQALDDKNIAYVIYTSGSTGLPKAVCVPHTGVINTARAKVNHLKIHRDSRVLQFASHAFDGSVQEIFSTFYARATLVLPPSGLGMDNVAYLPDYLQKFAVTHATLPQLLWRYWKTRL